MGLNKRGEMGGSDEVFYGVYGVNWIHDGERKDRAQSTESKDTILGMRAKGKKEMKISCNRDKKKGPVSQNAISSPTPVPMTPCEYQD